MPWMWTILKKVGSHTSDCIDRTIEDKAQYYREVERMKGLAARGRAASEVHAEVKRLFQEGGVDAVREGFQCSSREYLSNP